MARKTIKGLEVIITDLEKRLNEQNKINVELHNKISQMQPDDKFENSPIYHQMVKEIEKLKAIIRLYFILNLCAKFSLKSQPSIYGKYGKWIL